jgi:predicted permease
MYGAVLRCAPERFRDRYAQEAVELASVRLRETRGAARKTVRAIRELVDALATVRAERRAARAGTGRSFSKRLPMDALIQDIRQALRGVVRGPAAASAAICTYALGIGANVAIFSVAWPALFAPLPFPEEDRLTAIWLTYPGRDNVEQINPVSVGDYNDLRTAQSFSDMAAYGHFLREVNVTADGSPQQLQLGHVTSSFFTLMGVRPTAGRVLALPDAGGEQPSIVLSERAWRTRFGGNPAIVGRTVGVDGEPMRIIGVVPTTAGLGTIDPDAWTLMDLPPGRERLRSYRLGVVGRLTPGVSRKAANEELRAIMALAALEFPDANRHLSARADDFREQLTGPIRTPMLVLLGGAALVLLVAGINLAGLQIARNLHRAHELGIRHALGASRLRLLSQLVAENLTLALAGGAIAMAFATVTLRAVEVWAPANEWHTGQTASTGPVLIFTLIVSLVTGVAVALLPSWRASAAPRPEAAYARGSTASRTAARGRVAIISAQVALSVVLLVVSALVAASLVRVVRVDPGFTFDAGLIADLSLPESRYDSAAGKTRFFDSLVERVEALPGVTRACVINQVPLDTASGSMTWVAEGATEMISSSPKSASPGCYAVLGVPLLRGRFPASRETEPVVAISQSMVRRLWPDGGDPIGRRVHLGLASGQLFTVVGVVGDIRNTSLERRPGYQVWLPHSSGYFTPRRLAVRALVPPNTLAPALRDILGELDRELALANIRTMHDIVRTATAPRRFTLLLLGGFALIALVLSAVGIYGVLAHLVGQRAREIGIRRALGAGTSHIARVIAGSTALAILIGTGAGLLGAWTLSTVVASLLFEMSATDPRAYVGVALLVGVVAVLAAWPPARRATRLDPLRALRQE